MSTEPTRDFFVSYNSRDLAIAEWIAWVLEEEGFSVYFQAWDFQGNFVAHMQEAHRTSERTLAVLSEHYFSSEFTLAEWSARFAEDPTFRNDRLVPVKVAPLSTGSLLAPILYADLCDCEEPEARKRLLDRVAQAMATERRKPQEPPAFPTPAGLAAELPGPTRHNLPRANRDFVGRSSTIDQLRDQFTNKSRVAITQAVTGLGGIGKTALAVEYAYRNLNGYRWIWWVRAEAIKVAEGDLALLAHELGLGDIDATPRRRLLAALRDTLATSTSWLLIFDNVEDPSLLDGLLPRRSNRHGHILITSRYRNWSFRAHGLELQVMSEPEAVALLTDDSRRIAPDVHEAALALVEDLGYLPLALAQAKAYMKETGVGIAAYRQRLNEARSSILQIREDSLDYPEPVARAWVLAIEKASKLSPGAETLLSLLAFFAADTISLDILQGVVELVPEHFDSPLALDQATRALARTSLISTSPGTVTVHRLVQAVVRDSLTRAEASDRIETAVALLARMLPAASPSHDPTTWPTLRELLPHILETHRLADQHEVVVASSITMLQKAGNYFRVQDDPVEADRLLRAALRAIEQEDAESPARPAVLNNVALNWRYAGERNKALAAYEEALEQSERILGEGHVTTGVILSNLGRLCSDVGRTDEAEFYLQRAVALGADLPEEERYNYPFWLNNYSILLKKQGKLVVAEEHARRAIQIGREVFEGPNHDVAIWQINLSLLLLTLGRYDEAEAEIVPALEVLETLLPEGHSMIVYAQDSLAKAQAQKARALRLGLERPPDDG